MTIAADIYHWHVKVLADIGVAKYDKGSQTVRYRKQPLFKKWVKRLKQHELS